MIAQEKTKTENLSLYGNIFQRPILFNFFNYNQFYNMNQVSNPFFRSFNSSAILYKQQPY